MINCKSKMTEWKCWYF